RAIEPVAHTDPTRHTHAQIVTRVARQHDSHSRTSAVCWSSCVGCVWLTTGLAHAAGLRGSGQVFARSFAFWAACALSVDAVRAVSCVALVALGGGDRVNACCVLYAERWQAFVGTATRWAFVYQALRSAADHAWLQSWMVVCSKPGVVQCLLIAAQHVICVSSLYASWLRASAIALA